MNRYVKQLKQTLRLTQSQLCGVAYAPLRISHRLRLGFCDSPLEGGVGKRGVPSTRPQPAVEPEGGDAALLSGGQRWSGTVLFW